MCVSLCVCVIVCVCVCVCDSVSDSVSDIVCDGVSNVVEIDEVELLILCCFRVYTLTDSLTNM